MKKRLLTILFGFIFYPTHSQVQKGAWSCSGEWLIGGTRFESGDWQAKSTFNPKAGFFINDQLELGCGLFFEYQYLEPEIRGQSYNQKVWGLNPFIRFFPGKNNKPLLIFTQFDGSVLHNNRKKAAEKEWWSYRASVSGGLHLFISKQVALEGKIGYHFLKKEKPFTELDVANDLLFIDLGMRFYLNKNNHHKIISFSEKLKKGYFSFGINNITPLANSTLGFTTKKDLWFGFFCRDYFFVGMGLGLGLDIPEVMQRATLAPFVQKYIPLTERVQGFAVAQMGFDIFGFNPTVAQKDLLLISGRLGFGLNYFLNKSVAIESSINYNQTFNFSSRSVNALPFTENGIGLDTGFRFFIK